jgi:hypothetical protein
VRPFPSGRPSYIIIVCSSWVAVVSMSDQSESFFSSFLELGCKCVLRLWSNRSVLYLLFNIIGSWFVSKSIWIFDYFVPLLKFNQPNSKTMTDSLFKISFYLNIYFSVISLSVITLPILVLVNIFFSRNHFVIPYLNYYIIICLVVH